MVSKPCFSQVHSLLPLGFFVLISGLAIAPTSQAQTIDDAALTLKSSDNECDRTPSHSLADSSYLDGVGVSEPTQTPSFCPPNSSLKLRPILGGTRVSQSPPKLGDLGGLSISNVSREDLCVHRSLEKEGVFGLPQPEQTLPIVYQDKWLIAVNKPAGLLSVPGRY